MKKLDHYSIYTLKLDKVNGFFHDLLDLKPGFRPNPNFSDYWLYGSDTKQSIIHLIRQKKYCLPLDIGEDTDAYDHIAFQADTYDGISECIKPNNWTHWVNRLPSSLACQIFVTGLHNLTVENVFQNNYRDTTYG